MIVGKKILVLGCSGSGKSTFARKLQELVGQPIVHLDRKLMDQIQTSYGF